jgi:hypothetical protein
MSRAKIQFLLTPKGVFLLTRGIVLNTYRICVADRQYFTISNDILIEIEINEAAAKANRKIS